MLVRVRYFLLDVHTHTCFWRRYLRACTLSESTHGWRETPSSRAWLSQASSGHGDVSISGTRHVSVCWVRLGEVNDGIVGGLGGTIFDCICTYVYYCASLLISRVVPVYRTIRTNYPIVNITFNSWRYFIRRRVAPFREYSSRPRCCEFANFSRRPTRRAWPRAQYPSLLSRSRNSVTVVRITSFGKGRGTITYSPYRGA